MESGSERRLTYGERLDLLVFGDEGPAIVFFHGGGWRGGTPMQFVPQCRYLASRGMVAATAQYRLGDAFVCMQDARTAIAHVRTLPGVDPARVAAGGGSAGGHIAACAAWLPDAVADACVLFNPVLDTSVAEQLIGERWREASPLEHVRPGLAPGIVFHGDADSLVPIEASRRYRDATTAAGNRLELVEYAGEQHGFFNHARSVELFEDTMGRADEFLQSLEWLSPADRAGAR